MKKIYEIICTICPKGCKIRGKKNQEEINIEGNLCKEGREYFLRQSLENKVKFTSTVLIENGKIKRLPVKTNKDIPNDKVFLMMYYLQQIKVQAPIKMGDIIVDNILGLELDLIATRSVEIKE